MSETNSAVVAAPTETHTDSAPEAVNNAALSTDAAAAPPKPSNPKLAAKQSMFERLRERIAAEPAATHEEPQPTEPSDSTETEIVESPSVEPVLDAQGRKHDPATGKFLPETGNDAPAAVEPPVDTPADGRIRIEIPEGHALREQGLDVIHATSEQEARAIRASLNSYVRRTEVEQARAEAAQAKEQALRLQAELQAREAWSTQVMDDGTLAKYEAIKSVDPEAAELFMEGARARLKVAADQTYQTLHDEQVHQAVEQVGRQVVSQIVQNAHTFVPPQVAQSPAYSQVLRATLEAWGREVDARDAAGQLDYADPYRMEDFHRHLRQQLLAHPGTESVLRQMYEAEQQQRLAEVQAAKEAELAAERERAKQEALREVAASAAQRHATRHPLGQIPSNARTDRQSVSTDVDISSIPAHERKRAIKQRIFGAAR